MPRRDPVEEALNRLRSIEDPTSADARAVLSAALASGVSVVVQRAAKIIADSHLEGFEDGLRAAFERLLEGGAKVDAGCGGKTAIVETLAKLRLPAEDVFLKASRHVQIEFGPEDTGARLRAQGIVALAEMGYNALPEEAVHLLVDTEVGARLGAVTALVTEGSRPSLLLLRMKALEGDKDPEIIYECLSGLVDRDPGSLEFVASFLYRGWVGPAAMALAGSRRPEVLELLKGALEAASEEDAQTLYIAMAMLRTDESLDYLFAQLNGRDIGVALQVYQALMIHESDPVLKRRLESAVKASKYRRLFAGPRRSWTE